PSWAWATSSRSDGRWAMRSGVLTVFRKELLEVSRDRRTLFFMIAMPLLLIPLIIQITTDFISDAEKEAASATLDYAIFGDEQLPELAQAFTRTPGFAAAPLADPAEIPAAVAEDRIDLALVVQPPGPGGQHTVELHYNNAPISSKVEPRTKQVLDGLG